MSDTRDHRVNAQIFAAVVGSLLEPNQGVIVHLEERGYFVFLSFNEEEQEYDVMINEDPEFLLVPNFQKVIMTDDEEEFKAKTTESHTLQ